MRKWLAFSLLATLWACSSPRPSGRDDPEPDAGAAVTCGNGRLDDGEKCDPELADGPGACPTSCDDGNPCTEDTLRGSPDGCDATCEHLAVIACKAGDACCPSGCTGTSDADCSTCRDECAAAGAVRCEQNSVVACGNFDGDSCLEWGPAAACDSGQTCNAGRCEAACVSACTSVGAKRCDEGGAVVVCADADGHGCLKWGQPERCPSPQVCTNGACAVSCADECPAAGDQRCVAGSTTQFETCGNFDADSCLEWGNARNCGANLVCSNASCVASCTNGCPSEGAHPYPIKYTDSDNSYSPRLCSPVRGRSTTVAWSCATSRCGRKRSSAT